MSAVRPLAVFDVDGTLVDSRASIQACLERAFTSQGLAPPGYDRGRMIVGLSLPDAMAALAPHGSDAVLYGLVQAYREGWQEMQARAGFHEPLFAGAADLLASLKAAGWRLAMATGKGRRGVEAVVAMHGWSALFDSTHCADDCPGKPHPAMLRAALERLEAGPEEAVMIGDTAFDMQMARAAGVRALGVTWGFHTPDEVRAGGAQHVSATFAELRRELERFGAAVAG